MLGATPIVSAWTRQQPVLMFLGASHAGGAAGDGSHVQLGVEFLQQLLGQHKIPDQPAIRWMANFIGMHHEHLKGSGHPRTLRAGSWPVADAFDILTSTRPCCRSASVRERLDWLSELAGIGEPD